MAKSARRFFIALPVDDEESIQSLSGITRYLKKNESFLKVVPHLNYHTTVKFIGSVKSELVDSIINSFLSLNQLKKVKYKIEGIGAFPSMEKPLVLWAGLKCDSKPLAELVQAVEELALSIGIAPENRKFIPHLTLARIKKEITIPSEFTLILNKEKDSMFASSVFRELVLYESILKNGGPEYKKIEGIKLI